MSKFILALDASQIKTYLTCPLQWYQQTIVSPEIAGTKNLALAGVKRGAADRGTYIHKLCDVYYSLRVAKPAGDKQSQAAAAIKFIRDESTTAETLGIDEQTEKFLCIRFSQYVIFYDLRNDDLRPLKDPEGNPGVEIPFSKILFEDNDTMYVVEGRMDLLCGFQGELRGWCDHKTQAQSRELYKFKPQFLTYAWATEFKFGLINYIGMQKDATKWTFRRTLITFPEWRIEEWGKKMLQVFKEVHEGLTHPDPPIFFWNKKVETSCAGAFETNPCMFTHLCEIEPWNEKLKQHIIAQKYKLVSPWKPWSISDE